MNFGQRLSEERKRIGLNQTEFGKIAGITKTSQVNYEAGERSPNVDYWQSIAAIGADVLYILTGVRSQKSSEVVEKTEDFLTKTRNDIEEIVDDLEIDDALDTLRFVQYRKRVNELVKEVEEMKKENLRKNME